MSTLLNRFASKAVNQRGSGVKKGQNSINVVCERTLKGTLKSAKLQNKRGSVKSQLLPTGSTSHDNFFLLDKVAIFRNEKAILCVVFYYI